MEVEDVESGLRNLQRLSLLTVTGDQVEAGAGSVRGHALVQRGHPGAEGRLPDLDAAAQIAADALLEVWPEVT